MLPRCDRKLRHAAFCGLGYATTILVCGKDLDLSSLVRRGCAVLSCCRHVVYPTCHMRRDRWLTDVREDDCEEAICLAAMMGEGESFTRVSMLTCNLSGPSDFIIKKKDYPEETLMPWSDVLEATAPQLSRELMRVTGETISSTHGRSSLNLPTIADRKDAQSRARKRVLLQDTALHCHWSTCMSPQASPGHPRPLLRVLNEPGSTSRRTEKIAENAFTVESM